MNRRLGPAVIMLVVVSLISAGCGSGAATGAGQSLAGQQGTSSSQGQAQGGTGAGPAGMDQIGMPVVDGLMAELAAVPVPDGAGFTRGTSIGDRSGTVVQDAYTDQAVDEAFAYYTDALPATGFQVTSTEPGDAGGIIEFVDPDGHPGKVVIQPSALGPPTNIHIEVYLDREPVRTSTAPAAEGSDAPATQVSAVLEVEGTAYDMRQGVGDCVISDSEINVALSFSSGFVTAVGAPSGGWMQVSLQSGELWTGGLASDSPPARFEVNGTSVTWSGPMVETISSRQSDGSLTIEC